MCVIRKEAKEEEVTQVLSIFILQGRLAGSRDLSLPSIVVAGKWGCSASQPASIRLAWSCN